MQWDSTRAGPFVGIRPPFPLFAYTRAINNNPAAS